MKILLIDDKANAGWKQLLELIFPIKSLNIDTALSYESAIQKLESKYDFIFLDVRLTSDDHHKANFEELTGYKILKQIKQKFENINFSTPIILLTASNKIWYIDAFKEFGIDSYYIKEHPDTIYNKDISRKNYEHLLTSFDDLIVIGPKRYNIWNFSNQIIEKISNHNYFKGDKKYENIKQRIIDKLYLGYSYLFKQETLLEKKVLKTNNEAIAFIIYFSILEELVKGLTEKTTWNNLGKFQGNWKFKNGEYFIEVKNQSEIIVNRSLFKDGKYIPSQEVYNEESEKLYNYFNGKISLNDQVHSLLAAYTINNRPQFNSLAKSFNQVRQFRNNVDYIHGNVYTIFNKDLISKELKNEHFDYSVKTLEFINTVLKLI